MVTSGLEIAFGAHSSGQVSVDGHNSSLSTGLGGIVVGVGLEGNASLTITNGARVQSGQDQIGGVGNSVGSAMVDGAEWFSGVLGGGSLIVGGGAGGGLIVQNGGVVDFGPGTIDIGAFGPGTLKLQNNAEVSAGQINIGNQGLVMVQQSTSTLTGNVTNHGSLILDPSILNIFGNYTLARDGTMFIDIAGLTSDLVSQLNISGSGLFQGAVALDFIGGFAPKMGDSFDVLNILGGADFGSATFQIEGLEPGFRYSDTFSNGSFRLVALNDGGRKNPEVPTATAIRRSSKRRVATNCSWSLVLPIHLVGAKR